MRALGKKGCGKAAKFDLTGIREDLSLAVESREITYTDDPQLVEADKKKRAAIISKHVIFPEQKTGYPLREPG